MKTVRPHTCQGGCPLVSSLLVVDYREEMKGGVAEKAHMELSKSPLTLALKIYRKYDSLGNEEGGICHFVTHTYNCHTSWTYVSC